MNSWLKHSNNQKLKVMKYKKKYKFKNETESNIIKLENHTKVVIKIKN